MSTPADATPRYLILRGHEEYGPYEEVTLREGLETGQLLVEDLVREEDNAMWSSLGDLLCHKPRATVCFEPLPEPIGEVLVFERRPRTMEFLNPWLAAVRPWMRWISKYPGTIAVVCIAAAIGSALLPDTSIAWWGPWVLATILAGATLMSRQRLFAGLAACLTAIVAPFGLVFYALQSPDTDTPAPMSVSAALAQLPSTKPTPQALKRHPRVKSTIPALDLPQPALADER